MFAICDWMQFKTQLVDEFVLPNSRSWMRKAIKFYTRHAPGNVRPRKNLTEFLLLGKEVEWKTMWRIQRHWCYTAMWEKIWRIRRKECRLVRVPIKSNKISNPSIEFTIGIFSLLLGSLCYPKFESKPIGDIIYYCLPWFIWSNFKEIISRPQELPIAGKIPSRREIRYNFSIPPLVKQKNPFRRM